MEHATENVLDEPSAAIDPEQLREAFRSFEDTSRRLEERYEEMKSRVAELNIELEAKNRLLEDHLAEKEKARNQLNRIIESLTNGVIVTDTAGAIRIHNSSACSLTGLDSRWFEYLSAGELFEAWLRDVNSAEGLAHACETGDAYVAGVGENGGQRRVEVTRTALLDSNGNPAGHIYLLRDITRQVLLQMEAERTDRLSAMGEMAASIVHEVRNPLGSIELYASLLRQDLADDPDKRPLAENITAGVRNLDQIINNLLTFTRNRMPVKTRVRLDDLVRDSVRYTDHLFGGGIDLSIENRAGEDSLEADAELMKQVLMNLILNGVQAMEGGGRLSLEIAEGQPGTPEEGYLCVRVSDDGCGMTEEVSRRVFNPFFSTKDHGTGLGLALVHNIVRAHGGHVSVQSGAGEGTTFTLLLPRT